VQPNCAHDHLRKPPAASRTSAPPKGDLGAKLVSFEAEVEQLTEDFGKIPNPAKRQAADAPAPVIRRRTTNGVASSENPCKDMPFCAQYFSCRYYHKICEQGVGCPHKKCPFTHCSTEEVANGGTSIDCSDSDAKRIAAKNLDAIENEEPKDLIVDNEPNDPIVDEVCEEIVAAVVVTEDKREEND